MTGFTGPIRIRPESSVFLAIGLALAHLGALLIAALLPWPGWAKLVLALSLAASLCWSLAWHVWRRGDAIIEAILHGDGSWTVETRQAEALAATLAPDSLVTLPLTVLVFTLAAGRRRALLVLPDTIDPETNRRLRVRLRFPTGGRG